LTNGLTFRAVFQATTAMDGAIESCGVGESLVSQMMGFEINLDALDVVEFGRILGQPLHGEPMGPGGERRGCRLADVDRPAPNILPLSFLYGSVAIGWAILTEAAVSFVGFGDPSRTSWGFMLQDAFVSQALSRGSWHWFLPPGICIVLVVVAGFFISRGAEAVLFPKLRS
jgi:hypothetical protein